MEMRLAHGFVYALYLEAICKWQLWHWLLRQYCLRANKMPTCCVFAHISTYVSDVGIGWENNSARLLPCKLIHFHISQRMHARNAHTSVDRTQSKWSRPKNFPTPRNRSAIPFARAHKSLVAESQFSVRPPAACKFQQTRTNADNSIEAHICNVNTHHDGFRGSLDGFVYAWAGGTRRLSYLAGGRACARAFLCGIGGRNHMEN